MTQTQGMILMGAAALSLIWIAYAVGWGHGNKFAKREPNYKPKSITVKGEKIELYEN